MSECVSPVAAWLFHSSLLWRTSWLHVTLKLLKSTEVKEQLPSDFVLLPSLALLTLERVETSSHPETLQMLAGGAWEAALSSGVNV